MEKNESSQSLTTFIALWDEDYGPMIEGQFPEMSPYENIEGMATNLFMTFQTIFGEAADVNFKKMNLSIPFKSENCIALILLDVVPNEEVRAGLQPFIVVVLIPGDMDEKSIETFDLELEKVAQQYKATTDVSLQDHMNNFQNIFNLAQQFDELEVDLQVGYDLQAAVADFKSGIEFFQKKNTQLLIPY